MKNKKEKKPSKITVSDAGLVLSITNLLVIILFECVLK